ncbi:MAG: Glycerophosphoryl diester phosphodiesterase, partial [uncultured Frankineae bacterium]
ARTSTSGRRAPRLVRRARGAHPRGLRARAHRRRRLARVRCPPDPRRGAGVRARPPHRPRQRRPRGALDPRAGRPRRPRLRVLEGPPGRSGAGRGLVGDGARPRAPQRPDPRAARAARPRQHHPVRAAGAAAHRDQAPDEVRRPRRARPDRAAAPLRPGLAAEPVGLAGHRHELRPDVAAARPRPRSRPADRAAHGPGPGPLPRRPAAPAGQRGGGRAAGAEEAPRLRAAGARAGRRAGRVHRRRAGRHRAGAGTGRRHGHQQPAGTGAAPARRAPL